MTNAPEKIWTTGDVEMTTGSWNDHPVDHHPNQHEYIRADIHAAQVERNKALVEAAEVVCAKCESPHGAVTVIDQQNLRAALAANEEKNDG